MRFFDWLARWIRGDSRSRGSQRRDQQRRTGLASERLEARQLPAVFTVRPDVPDGQPGSLRDAVVRGNQNKQSDVIQLLPGRYTLGATDGDLDLLESGRSVVLQGSGTASTILDAAGFDRLLEVNSGVTVTLRDLTLTGGRTTGEGGAIFAQNGRVVLDNVVVEGNQSEIGGGALSATNSNVTIVDSRIASNSVESSSVRDVSGGGILSHGSRISLWESELSRNTAIGSVGSAGSNGQNAQDPWTHATSGGNGGLGSSATGGGIAQASGTLSIHRTVIAENMARAGEGGRGGNGGRGDWVNGLNGGLGGQGGAGGTAIGGGISVVTGSLTVMNSEITLNQAIAGNGGLFGNHGEHPRPRAGQHATDGGRAEGGGVTVAAGQATLVNADVQGNRAAGGNASPAGHGGSGAVWNGSEQSGANGGNGANGGTVRGSGLVLGTDLSALIDTEIINNTGIGGSGSNGGSGGGSRYRLGGPGGAGGNGGDVVGTGLVSGPVLLIDADISTNLGTAGAAGQGALSGQSGEDYSSFPRTRASSGLPGIVTENAAGPISNQSAVINLTANAQPFVLSRGGADVVLRDASGNELFRNAVATATRLEIIGTDGDETLVIDLSSGDPVPVGGVAFRGMGQTSGDVLELRGTATWVIQDVLDGSAGRFDVDGSLIEFSQVERVSDRIVAETRLFAFGDSADTIALLDGAQPGDGISRLTLGGQTVAEFTNPSFLLSVSAGGGNDVLRVVSVDSTLVASIRLDGGDGDDQVTSQLAAMGVRLQGGVGNDLLDSNNAPDTLIGDDGLDTLNGRSGADWMLGGDGDDSMSGGGGNDLMAGDAGSDTVIGNSGSDLLFGGDGDDSMRGSTEDDTLDGGAGFDRAVAVVDANIVLTDSSLTGEGADVLRSMEAGVLIGGAGANRLDASAFTGTVTLRGSLGDDTLLGGSQADLLQGDEGHDSLIGNEGNDVLTGSVGNDNLDGGAGTNRLVESFDVNMYLTDTSFVGFGTDLLQRIQEADLTGGLHNNRLDARAFRGRVTLRGGAGDDILRGGSTADLLLGEEGNDYLVGNAGDDRLEGGVGTDDYSGGGGTDRLIEFVEGDATLTATQLVRTIIEPHLLVEEAELIGGAGPNRLIATAFVGRVTLDGGDGDDSLDGTRSSDLLRGGTGRDALFGRQGDDSLQGDADDDELSGGLGNDVLAGGTGNDVLMGQEGRDVSRGDAGADLFRGVLTDDTLDGGDGPDRLMFTTTGNVTLNDSSLIADGTASLTGIELAELSGGPADQRLDASGFSGDTTLTGARGRDTLLGGRGNDLFLAPSLTEDNVSGGRGENTLRLLTRPATLDLNAQPNLELTDINHLDLRGSEAITITFDAATFIREHGDRRSLFLNTDANDRVIATDPGWSASPLGTVNTPGRQRFQRSLVRFEVSDGTAVDLSSAQAPLGGVFVESDQRLTNLGLHLLADIDNDGDLDIVEQYSGSPQILTNDGSGVFTKVTPSPIESPPGEIYGVIDIDGDGFVDIVGKRFGYQLLVWLNDGLGHFRETNPQFGDIPKSYLLLGDFDNDGDQDVLGYNRSVFIEGIHLQVGKLQVAFNDGTGHFTIPDPSLSALNTEDGYGKLLPGDLDGDGDLDLLMAEYGARPKVLLNDGRGKFSDARSVSETTLNGLNFALGDIDGDGDLDLWNDEGRDRILLNDGQAHFSVAADSLPTITNSYAGEIVLADVDGDGDLDAIVPTDDMATAILLNNGQGRFVDDGIRIGQRNASSRKEFISVGDLDNDGDLDAVVGMSQNQNVVSVWFNESPLVRVTLPDSGGDFVLIRDGEDVVMRDSSGTELFRQRIAEIAALQIVGSNANDRVTVDLSGGDPSPQHGIRFAGGSGTDQLLFAGPNPQSVGHIWIDAKSGNVVLDGVTVAYFGVETVVENFAAADRFFQLDDNYSNATLDGGSETDDGRLRLRRTGSLNRTWEFIVPTTSLEIRGGFSHDTIVLTSLDPQFTGSLRVLASAGYWDYERTSVDASNLSIPVTIIGGLGDNTLIGGSGSDTLIGGPRADRLEGRAGDDVITGVTNTFGADTLDGGIGRDNINGQLEAA